MRGLPQAMPIRIRLTLAFAAAMGLVLAATGLFLYLRLGSALDQSVDAALRDRAADVVVLAHRSDAGLRAGTAGPLPEAAGFAQILDATGTVVDATPLGERFDLTPSQLTRVTGGRTMIDHVRVPGSDDPYRVLVSTVDGRADRLVVVGASLEARAEALDELRTQLLLGGSLALLLSSFIGYGIATAALRPVESMRREAAAVSAAEPGRRLTLPPARDEIARLGTTLNEMLARLEAAFTRERRFVADASHELRTPLALLRAELELALRRKRTPGELESALRSAAAETDRLCRLAADLLVLARADQGALPVRTERLAVAALLSDVRERFAGRAAAAGRPLAVDAEAGLEMYADRLRIEQAIANLVENGLGHSDGRVLLRALRRDGHIELHVRDFGPGFADDILHRAFEPFSRGDAARSTPGSGLGLAIVDLIARAHGGTAHAINTTPGADVWLSIPDQADD
jgi:signal transduction histidine kinase